MHFFHPAKNLASIAVVITSLLFTACSSQRMSAPSAQAANQPAVMNIVNTDVNQLWDQGFDHHQTGLLTQVADAISVLALKGDLDSKALDKLTYYLRIYSSFGPDEDWPAPAAQSLNNALIRLHNMPGFYQLNETTARLHENYAVALYRLYFLSPLRTATADHVKPLSRLIKLYANAQLPKGNATDYALWEILRASAILPFEARRKNEAEFTQALTNKGELQQALLDFVSAPNSIRDGDNWPQQHAVWALAHYYNLYDKQYWNEYYQLSKDEQKKLDDDKTSLPYEQPMDDLDNNLWLALSSQGSSQGLAEDALKTLYSTRYVVSTFRGKSACAQGSLKDRCISPTIDQALPINHVCSDSLTIRAQQMSAEQLNETCIRLTSQETTFHQKLATQHQPVANDYNNSLRVVIFNDQSQYNQYGQLVFDINTDNGGMYLEGTTQNPDNIATFYAYEQFWARPEFKVWNLNHEYVHYLDGRFVKYDTYNHFPGQMVWWSEGLAEYISLAENSPRASKTLAKTELSEMPTLPMVFNTEYKDGLERVYHWGYWAVRYMYEEHREQYRQLAHLLKTDYFAGYKKLLDETGEQHKADFARWLADHKAKNQAEKEVKDPRKPRPIYRYTVKPDLKPSHLTEDPLHMIWQYWHENAL
ncbi:MAG: microbial collagenase [Phenylobacterium sp.]|jgi:microbial collagenase